MTWRNGVLLVAAAGVLTTALVAPVQTATTAAAAPTAKTASSAKTVAAKKYWKTHYCYGKTVKVDDGDTIDVKLTKGCLGWKKGKKVVARLAAIQATEVKHPWSKAECWGNEARTFMRKEFKKGSKVRLTAYTKTKSDVKTADGRTRYVMYAQSWHPKTKGGPWIDAQQRLVEAGLAFLKAEHVEYAHNTRYLVATQKAIHNRKGMWGNAGKCGKYSTGAKLQAWTGWKTNGRDSKALANTEWFKVRNVGTVPVPLYNWKVRDGSKSFGGGKTDFYTIKSRATLKPGQTFTLYPGKGTNDAASLRYYNKHPRLPFYPNAHAKSPTDAGAGKTKTAPAYGYAMMLMDPGGNFRAQSVYPCVYACAKPNLTVTDVNPRGAEQATIVNTGRTTVDLTGVVVQVSSARYEFTSGQKLAAGGRIVVYFNRTGRSSFAAVYFGESSGRLPDGGGKIWLRTADAKTIHMKSWGNGGSYVF